MHDNLIDTSGLEAMLAEGLVEALLDDESVAERLVEASAELGAVDSRVDELWETVGDKLRAVLSTSAWEHRDALRPGDTQAAHAAVSVALCERCSDRPFEVSTCDRECEVLHDALVEPIATYLLEHGMRTAASA